MTARDQVKRRIAEWEQLMLVISAYDERSAWPQAIGSVEKIWEKALGCHK
jgi:hypothetical protein